MSRHSSQLSISSFKSFRNKIVASLPPHLRGPVFSEGTSRRDPDLVALAEAVAAKLPPQLAAALLGKKVPAAAATAPPSASASIPAHRSHSTMDVADTNDSSSACASTAPTAVVRAQGPGKAARPSALSAAAPPFYPAARRPSGRPSDEGDAVAAVEKGLKRRESPRDDHGNASKATEVTQTRGRSGAKRFKMRPGGVYSATLDTQDWKHDGWMTKTALFPAPAPAFQSAKY